VGLEKKSYPLNFTQGVNTKADPKQVQFGKFLDLQNSIFDIEGQLTKRNGFQRLDTLPTTDSTFLTTFNGNLTAIGNELYAYSQSGGQWVNKGSTQPLDLRALNLVKNNTNQTQADMAVSPNGLVCVAYTDNVPVGGNLEIIPKYSVLDVNTGQNIVPPTPLSENPAVGQASPKVFILGNYFVIVYTVLVISTPQLRYIAVSIADPSIVLGPEVITTTYTPNSRVAWDGVVANNTLYLAWNGSDLGGAIRATSLNSTLVQSTVVDYPGEVATTVSVCADTSPATPIIYISYHDNATQDGYVLAVDAQLQPALNSTPIITSELVANLTSIVQDGVLRVFYEVLNNYSFGASELTDYISKVELDVNNVAATLVQQGVTYTALGLGPTGTFITITLVDPLANNSPLSINVTATNISVSLETDGAGLIITDADALVTALQADIDVVSLITVSGTGATPLAALVQTGLELPTPSDSVVVRSVGLASKAFSWQGLVHFLTAYSNDYQPSYFLVNEYGEVAAKLAYGNGGGYCHTGIPNAQVIDNTIYTPYLYRNRIQAVNKDLGGQGSLPAENTSPGIYAQTGVSLAKFEFGISSVVPVEIGSVLNLSGGFVWSYDGLEPVEQGFHVYPDHVYGMSGGGNGAISPQKYFYTAVYEWGDNQGNIFRSAPSIPVEVDLTNLVQLVTFDAIFTSNDTTLVVSDTTNLFVGQILTDNDTPGNLAANTRIVAIDVGTSTVTIDQPTLGASAGSPGDELQTETTLDVEVYVPTLRLTYKINNPVKITIYRWSEAQQTYYQVTSIANPTLNDTLVDNIVFTDTAADSSIAGNSILYTTGGVVENIAAPASPVMTVLKNRLFVLDSENRNLWWFSKPIVPGEPVEMSDLFTYFVNPTLTGQGSTGEITAGAGMDDKLISFKRDAIYYTTGNGPDATGNNNDFSEAIFVTSTVGCTNQQSIVFMPKGLMFQSDKGIWLLGRDLSTTYIGAPVQAYNNQTVLSAVNVPGTNQVRFTMSGGKTLVYDYYYDQWCTFTNVPAIASTLYENRHTFVNERGELYQESPGRYLDGAAPVLMGFTTSWINLAGLQGYERAYYFYLLGMYLSQHKIGLSIAYDYNDTPQQYTVVTPDNLSTDWGDEAVWGSGEAWGGSDNVEQWRVFLQIQKCQSFRITFQELQNTFDLSPPSKAGLTVSGLNLVVGLKKGYPVLKASRSVG
jgi:hypothetical protein